MVTGDDPPPRGRTGWAALAFVALGIFSLWLGLSGLLPMVGGIRTRAPIVAFRPGDLVPLPIAAALFAIASMTLIPRNAGPKGRAKKEADRRFWRAATGLLYVAAAGAIVAAAIAPIGRALVASYLERGGYRLCPPSGQERHPPLRWFRPGGRCPRAG